MPPLHHLSSQESTPRISEGPSWTLQPLPGHQRVVFYTQMWCPEGHPKMQVWSCSPSASDLPWLPLASIKATPGGIRTRCLPAFFFPLATLRHPTPKTQPSNLACVFSELWLPQLLSLVSFKLANIFLSLKTWLKCPPPGSLP